MNTIYEQGYLDAVIYDWDKPPIDAVFKMIDDYKAWAVKMQNEYLAGLAHGAQDAVMARVVGK